MYRETDSKKDDFESKITHEMIVLFISLIFNVYQINLALSVNTV